MPSERATACGCSFNTIYSMGSTGSRSWGVLYERRICRVGVGGRRELQLYNV